jgi:hypothetical protein
MRLSGSLLDAVKISKDYAVSVLEAAADKPTPGGQQPQLQQQRKQPQVAQRVTDVLVSWLSLEVHVRCGHVCTASHALVFGAHCTSLTGCNNLQSPAHMRVQGDCCNADGGGGGSGAVQQAGAMACQQASSEAASSDLAQRLWALPFKQRVELCTGIFRGLEPVRQTLQEHGATVYDGFALETE